MYSSYFKQLLRLLPFFVLALVVAGNCTKTEELDGRLKQCDDAGGICIDACPAGTTDKTCDLTYVNFYVKNRSSSAASGLSAYEVRLGELIAESDHFVMYREFGSSLMSPADASQILFELEPGYDILRDVYGNGKDPDVQKTGRIVLAAFDIQDDYAPGTNNSFIAGFFNPPDLFNDQFTQELYGNLLDDPTYYTNQTDLTVDTLLGVAGHSNENSIVYLDLDPFFNGDAYEGDSAAAYDRFIETAIHELSHLFTYYWRVKQDYRENHDSWIAEGIAEQAPMVVAGLTEILEDRLEQYGSGTVQSYLTGGASLIGLDSTGSTIAGYSQTSLFFNYLRHRAGSAGEGNLLGDVVTEANSSVSGLDNALSDSWSNNQDFGSLFEDWVIATYRNAVGKDINTLTVDGSLEDKDDFNYENVDILEAGESGVAFPENSLPLSLTDTSLTCLDPGAYLFFEYTIPDGTTTAYVPSDRGMNSGLKAGMVTFKSNGTVDIQAGPSATTFSLNESVLDDPKVNFMAYNPNFSGGCLSTGLLPWDTRNIAAWIGEGQVGWQTLKGASEGTGGDTFKRPTGIDMSFGNNPDGRNYAYVADKNNHGISRWDVDTGQWHGRLGSDYLGTCVTNGTYTTQSDCETNGETWDPCGDIAEIEADDGWNTNTSETLVINHCTRSFGFVNGLAVVDRDVVDVEDGDLIIADTSNHRILWWDQDGTFVAWAGALDGSGWKCGSGTAHAKCTAAVGEADDPFDPDDISITDKNETVAFCTSPNDIFIDPVNDFFYVACYGSSRVQQRELSSGDFIGYIGNGDEGSWMTGNRSTVSNANHATFELPQGITGDANYLYITDTGNSRISRWTYGGENVDTTTWLGNGYSGWHDNATDDIGKGQNSFQFPTSSAVDGTYIYTADFANQRIVRRNKTTGAFAGWIGGGVVEWELTQEETDQVDADNTISPPFILKNPLYLVLATAAETGANHDYLYITNQYNARVTRWNLDCLDDIDDVDGACSD